MKEPDPGEVMLEIGFDENAPYLKAMRERRGPPLNEWREVCRWDVGETPLEERGIDYERAHAMQASEHSEEPHPLRVQMTAKEWEDQYWKLHKVTCEALDELEERRDLTDSLLTCYEELAGEHRELWEAFMRDAEALSTPCPGDPEDYTFVRAYYRPRRSKLAAIDPDQGTVQAAPGEGQSGASGGQPEAFSIDLGPGKTGVVMEVGRMGDFYGYMESIPQSGEERSE